MTGEKGPNYPELTLLHYEMYKCVYINKMYTFISVWGEHKLSLHHHLSLAVVHTVYSGCATDVLCDICVCVCLQDGEQFVKKIGGVFAFKVKDGPGGKEAIWIVDVKNGTGSVHNDAGESVLNADSIDLWTDDIFQLINVSGWTHLDQV